MLETPELALRYSYFYGWLTFVDDLLSMTLLSLLNEQRCI